MGIVPTQGRMSAAEVVQHAVVVQEVMRAVMKQNVHFGVIPGTDKPTLYQPGADVLCMTFRIAAQFEVEDLSTPDMIRYRVTCRGVHQTTGITLGSGIGEGSTSEEKYKWRRAVNDKEFEATPQTMRRVKYGKNYETKQIRTEPADVANTVLKMAAKRAKIAMVLNVTAASDMFGQDLEDLDETLRESLAADSRPTERPELPPYSAEAFEKNLPAWSKLVADGKKTPGDLLATLSTKATFTEEQKARVMSLKAAPPAPPPPAAPVDDDFVRDMNNAEGSAQ